MVIDETIFQRSARNTGFHEGFTLTAEYHTHGVRNTKQMGDGFAVIDWLEESESSFVTSDIYTTS